MKYKIMACMILANALLYAQNQDNAFSIPKNTWVLEGQFSYSNETNKEIPDNSEFKATRFLIAPSIGYAINNNVVIGSSIEYLYSYSERIPVRQFLDDSKRESSIFGLSPYITTYYNITNKLLLDLEGRIGYSVGKLKMEDLNFTFKSSLFSISILPGITYGIHKKLALKLNLGVLSYSRFNFEPSGMPGFKSKDETFAFGFQTSNLRIGFIYLLN